MFHCSKRKEACKERKGGEGLGCQSDGGEKRVQEGGSGRRKGREEGF